MTGDCTNGPLGWLSILLSSALLVLASVETHARLTPETSAGVTDVSRSSRDRALAGTPRSEWPRISATVPVQIHGPTPLLAIGKTPPSPTPGSPRLTPKPEALSVFRGLISQPAESSEPSKSSLGPTLVPVENHNTKMPPTAHLDLSTRHPPNISSIPGRQAHSTSFATPSRPPVFGGTSLDFSAWSLSPTPSRPSHHPNTITPGTPSMPPLTVKADVHGGSSTPGPPQGSTSSFVGGSTPSLGHDGPPGLETTKKMSFSTSEETSGTSGAPSASPGMTDLAPRAVWASSSSISAASDTRESPRTSQTGSTATAPAPTPGPCWPGKTPPPSRPRPSRDLVRPCLVAIACLAALAAAFLMSTVVLCVRRSGRKYRVQRAPEQTEMTFMSALMPERKSGGAARSRSDPFSAASFPAIHSVLDSDDDIADNLTLSSFLQDNERFV
ncbi:P-selectin glycoprotein ligand 1 [Stigmatopora argus]